MKQAFSIYSAAKKDYNGQKSILIGQMMNDHTLDGMMKLKYCYSAEID